jgi:hypothetical protein
MYLLLRLLVVMLVATMLLLVLESVRPCTRSTHGNLTKKVQGS